MERRGFLKLSGTTAAAIFVAPSLITEPLRAADGKALYESYDKIMLKDPDGNPLKVENVVEQENYVFHFPHVATPCILVKLDGPCEKNVTLTADDGTEYTFNGGIGDGSIVAYSAICPHQLTHPTQDTSFFQYVPKGTKTLAYDKAVGGVFVCSSHLSAFTPKDGGRRVTGPATEGLTQIVLEVDEKGVIWAVGALGPNKFHEYLKAFKGEFKKYYGNKRKAKKLVKSEAKVITLKNFSSDIQQF